MGFAYFHPRAPEATPRDSGIIVSEATNESRIWTALQTSVGVFWNSALLFAMAICIAAHVVISTTKSSYSIHLSALSATLAISVVLATTSLYLQNCRYRKARLTGLFLVWVTYFAVALRYYARFTSVTAAEDPSPEVADAFEAICIRRPRVIQEAVVPGITLIAFLPVGLCLLPASVYAIGMAGRWMGLHQTPFPRHTRQPVGWSQRMYLYKYVGMWLFSLPLMVATAIAMIAVLIALTSLRYETTRLAGPSLIEANWSFGQILSFATWAPTIVDFLVVLIGKACDDSRLWLHVSV